jgi:hypothetical protein
LERLVERQEDQRRYEVLQQLQLEEPQCSDGAPERRMLEHKMNLKEKHRLLEEQRGQGPML